MLYTTTYKSPIGNLLIASKDNKLVGLWIENQKYYLSNIREKLEVDNKLEILVKTKKWLNEYFCGKNPNVSKLNISPDGSEFRKSVWQILKEIPYGEVITYNSIAKKLAKQKGIKRMSAQAVGGAVAHNPISIIIPCHRVIGTNGSLTGYAGGIARKIYLLEHEKVNRYKLLKEDNFNERNKIC